MRSRLTSLLVLGELGFLTTVLINVLVYAFCTQHFSAFLSSSSFGDFTLSCKGLELLQTTTPRLSLKTRHAPRMHVCLSFLADLFYMASPFCRPGGVGPSLPLLPRLPPPPSELSVLRLAVLSLALVRRLSSCPRSCLFWAEPLMSTFLRSALEMGLLGDSS